MKLTLSTILTFSVFLSTTCPSAVNNNNNRIAPKETTFNDLPMELKEMIFLYAPNTYDSFFRAFPEVEGCPRIEMNRLMLTISEEEPTWRTVKEASHMALRLSSPVPLDPENPDIMKIAPSSILKWLRYFGARSKNVKHFEFALYYFARSDDFSQWYDCWTEDEKKEFGLQMGLALIFAGKIDEAFEIKDLKNLVKSACYRALSLDEFEREFSYFYFEKLTTTILFSAFLKDDPDYLQAILTKLSHFDYTPDPIDILTAALWLTRGKSLISTRVLLLAHRRKLLKIFLKKQ